LVVRIFAAIDDRWMTWREKTISAPQGGQAIGADHDPTRAILCVRREMKIGFAAQPKTISANRSRRGLTAAV
jgi:hypothetical protein